MDGRQHNRRVMPQTAAALEELGEAFGGDVRLVYAREGGYEVGTAIETAHAGDSVAAVYKETGRRRIGPRAKPVGRP